MTILNDGRKVYSYISDLCGHRTGTQDLKLLVFRRLTPTKAPLLPKSLYVVGSERCLAEEPAPLHSWGAKVILSGEILDDMMSIWHTI